jgi:type IV pilus assembly protein PilY1
MKKIILMIGLWMMVAFYTGFGTAHAAEPVEPEPSMADYTAYPVFMSDSAKPNILIMLDNSMSMNEQAYRGEYLPDISNCSTSTSRVIASYDDAEEILEATATDPAHSVQINTSNLYLGNLAVVVCDDKQCKTSTTTYHPTQVGLRFQRVQVPPGSTINSAYITFQAYANASDAAEITIHGQDSGNAAAFVASPGNISERSPTFASVDWGINSSWFLGASYTSPDLSGIVQEIVDNTIWEADRGMAFTFTGDAGDGTRAVRSWDFGGGAGPVLVIEYKLADDAVCVASANDTRYYGYFDPDARYSNPTGNVFVRTSGGAWDGNFLNWLSMRRIDITRKVLMGGLATSRTGGGNSTNYSQSVEGNAFVKEYDGIGVSPFYGAYTFGMDGGYIYVDKDDTPFDNYIKKIKIAVDKNPELDLQDFYEGNLAGVFQRLSGKANWGSTKFNYGTGTSQSGAELVSPIPSNETSLLTAMQNFEPETFTPLAESLYMATRYFEQLPVVEGLDYIKGEPGPFNELRDPFYQDQEVWCAKSFVLLLTDGASTMDGNIPAHLKDLVTPEHTVFINLEDGKDCNESTGDGCEYPDSGTDYLMDVAHDARTRDLRPDDIQSEQNVILYTVYAALGAVDPNARNLLKEAARQGGFEDRNGNGWPDGDYDPLDPGGYDPSERKEWDKDGDGVPDTYFEASDGYELEAKILAAINDILARAASGTAASVLATNAEGEGNLVQAYFRPVKIEDTTEVNWLGYLQSLWVDPCGNLREDSEDGINGQLDLYSALGQVDKIVSYYSDATSSDTMIHRYTKHYLYENPLDCNGAPADYVYTYETVPIEDISPIWEVGKVLAERDPDGDPIDPLNNPRRIFTFIDKDNNQTVDESTYASFDDSGEVIAFDSSNADFIKPYLGVWDYGNTGVWDYLGVGIDKTAHDTRVSNLIDYTRGTDFTGMRSRTIGGNVWKLGDIVHSTPVTIAAPADNYHIIYGDRSYQTFLDANRDRETAVYVGANDGMLHAFTSLVYDSDSGSYGPPGNRQKALAGEELWSYIPQSLLPHLKWLADPNYTHVYYVDFKPKVFDARIGDLDTDGAPTWRTILVCGFNMGGKRIWAYGKFGDAEDPHERYFYPAYVCMDITDPVNPKLLWERTYTELGMSRATPGVIRIEEKTGDVVDKINWYIVFGSGPTDYDGSSTQNGYVFVVDLKTGAPVFPTGASDWQFDTGVANTYMNSPASLDKNLTNSVDAIYFGDTVGNLYHVSTLDSNGSPSIPGSDWDITKIFSGPIPPPASPITAAVSLSVDAFDDVWVYFGTGSYLTDADKINDDPQYIIGIRDPLFKESPTILPLGIDNLFPSDDYTVYTNRMVDGPDGLISWYDLLGKVRNTDEAVEPYADYFDGWYRSLETTPPPSERVISKPAILGGGVYLPTFTPSADVCGFGGDSNFYALYYETGTAYFNPLLPNGSTPVLGKDYKIVKVKIPLGEGMPPPAVGIHVGREKGAKAFLQMSTGEVVEIEIETPFNIKSGLTTWRTN